jgi:DNA polymerase-1
MGVPTITKEDYEADDILATLATRGATAGMDVLVVSGDRDTLQLVNDRVTVLYPSARGVAELKRYTPAAVIERYGVLPHQYPEIAALVGETSDNLVGVDKVGEKTAVKWIQQYGSLDNLLAHVDEITGVVGQNLRDQTDRVLRNRQLNHLLTDMDVGVSLESLARKPIDVPAVREVFTRLAFKSLTERVVALAGGDPEPESASPVARPVVELPDERLLVDEELRHWLSLNKATPLGLSVRVQGDSITECGVASATEAIRVPVINDGRDHLPLVAALGDPVFSFVSYGAKNLVKALVRQWALVPRLAGDPSLIRWIHNPSRKSDSLESLVGEALGIEIPSPRADQLLPETDAVGTAVEAWLVLRAWAGVSGDLDPGSAAVVADIELPLLTILARMEMEGIAVDTSALAALEERLAATVREREAEAFGIIGHEVNLGSPKQLQAVLFEELGMPKTRTTKTGFSTDASALQDLQESNPHPFLDALLAHRDATKLRQIIEGLRSAVASDGRVHTTFDQMGTSTGRLSSLDPNVQNIPIRTEIGREIRACFVAGAGSEGLFTADYSQIEMRIMAHLSGDEALIQAFHEGEDLHRFVGARIFEVAPEDVTALMRTKVKAMSYGLAYGLSAFGLAKQLRIPSSEAKQLMTEYFRRFGQVRDYLTTVVAEAKVKGYTETIFGRRRPFPDLASPNRIVREAAERAALNAPIQGTAADIIKRAMIAIDRELEEKNMKSRMVLQVHDELVFELAPGERETLEKLVVSKMGSAAELAVPLDVQVGFGANWDHAAH